MTIGAGFLYGLGVFSGLVLAGLAFLIYLTLKPLDIEIPDDDDDAETAARINAATARVNASRGRVEDASQVAQTIEPGEPNAP